MSTDTMTRTEAAPRTARMRRWWRRRPVRKSLVLAHRWTSLVLGLFLVIETTTGAVLLYRTEYFRATHGEFYQHTDSAQPIGLERAREIVRAEHPDFTAAWVSNDNGIIAVGDPTFTTAYAVDPGTGRVNGLADLDGGVMGLMANVHDCALTCPTYPGYVSWLADPAPLVGMNWGLLLLVVLGLLMILLAITGLITWWPGIRKFSHGFRVRLGRGRFARDYDLHNVIGLVSVPFVLMWGVTGAAFYLPGVENAWLAITGGSTPDPNRYSFTPNQFPADSKDIGVDKAAAAALLRAPGEVRYLMAPTPDADYYTVTIAGSYAPYDGRTFFSGDQTVYVDKHDPTHVSAVDSAEQPVANTFYAKVFEPAHFGWLVGGWWRIIWLLMGLTPLALMVTGLSTWLYRNGVRRRRRKARA